MSCKACAAGAYCPASGLTAAVPCPAHTTSVAGASSLGGCTCLPDYLCTYQREVVLQLVLNTTLTLGEIQADSALTMAFRNGVLTALGLYGISGISAEFQGFSF